MQQTICLSFIRLFIGPLGGCIDHLKQCGLSHSIFADQNIDSIAKFQLECIAEHIPCFYSGLAIIILISPLPSKYHNIHDFD